MPNWCFNRLRVSGSKKDIQAFKEKAKSEDTDLSLNNLCPMPKELEGTQAPPDKPSKALIEKYGADNWYDWRVCNWGTKWDVKAALEDEAEGYLEYFFDSAWSPPVAWLEKVAEDYPKLSFRLRYDEPAMGFTGVATAGPSEKTNKAKL